jgi:hypothetical protein
MGLSLHTPISAPRGRLNRDCTTHRTKKPPRKQSKAGVERQNKARREKIWSGGRKRATRRFGGESTEAERCSGRFKSRRSVVGISVGQQDGHPKLAMPHRRQR